MLKTNIPATTGRPWKTAWLSMFACGLLFELVYNGCNWITTQRSDVGTWNFAWEFKIPFVPAMIVPYWTLNLFFIGAFFVCSDLAELRVLRNRITLAIVVAGTCFLLFPLRLAFPSPEVDGLFGILFKALRSFDQPHNLAPSLHIALRTIVWPIYIPRTAGLLHLALRVWFLLIGVSTIFVYQHQVMDIVTGWILAIACLHLIAQSDASADRTPRVYNRRVGTYYSIGAGLALTLALLAWPWASILLWPAVSLGTVAAGYFRLGSIVFRKRAGRLPFSTRVLLGPVLFGHYLSLVYYRRQCHAWDEVVPGVLIGRKLNDAEARVALAAGVTAVLDLTAEFSEARPLLKVRYRNIALLDLTAPTPQQLQDAVAFIESNRTRGKVYVHCKIGYSRSATAVGAFLLASRLAADVDGALGMLRKVRPAIIVRPEALAALHDYEASLRANTQSAPMPSGTACG